MKAKFTKRRMITAIVLLAVLLFSLAGLYMHEANRQLSADQITALREQYPLCGHIPPLFSMRFYTMAEVMENNDTFVYGTVEGEMSVYSKYISTGDPELDKKRQENGIADVYDFYSYTISVIEDTEGIYKAGDKIRIESNTAFIDFNPHLSDGMKIVIPVAGDSGPDGVTGFSAEGMYYVTEDGYVLSVIDEARMMMEEPWTGIKLEKLLRKVKK